MLLQRTRVFQEPQKVQFQIRSLHKWNLDMCQLHFLRSQWRWNPLWCQCQSLKPWKNANLKVAPYRKELREGKKSCWKISKHSFIGSNDTFSSGVVSSLRALAVSKAPIAKAFCSRLPGGVVLWRLDTVSAWHVADKFPEIWNQANISSTYHFLQTQNCILPVLFAIAIAFAISRVTATWKHCCCTGYVWKFIYRKKLIVQLFLKQIMSNRFSAITKTVSDLFVKDIQQHTGFTTINLFWIDTFLLDLKWNSCLIHSKICFVLRVACAPSKAVSPMPPGLGP